MLAPRQYAPAAPTAAQSAARHADIVADLLAGRAAPQEPRRYVQFKLNATRRDEMIEDMQRVCRPNRAGRGL